MITMKLKDNTEIEIIRDYGIGDLVTLTDCLEHLTKENLSKVEIGEAGHYTDLILTSYEVVPVVVDEEEVTEYHIHLREQTDIELRVGTLEAEMTEVQEALVEG